jgi:hypothetical protein
MHILQAYAEMHRGDRGRYAIAAPQYYVQGPDGLGHLAVQPGEFAVCTGISLLGDPEQPKWMLRTEHSSYGQLEWVEVSEEIAHFLGEKFGGPDPDDAPGYLCEGGRYCPLGADDAHWHLLADDRRK